MTGRNKMKDNSKNKCLTDRDVALFIDLKSGYTDYDRVTAHISRCGECLDRVLEVRGFLGADVTPAPRELAEKAFRKSAIEIGKSMFWRSARGRRIAGSMAAAAVLFIVILAGIYNFRPGFENMRSADNNTAGVNTAAVSSARPVSVQARSAFHRREIKKQELMNNPLKYAGYLYFLVVSSEEPDRHLINKLISSLGGTKLNLKNSAILLKQGWYELFQKEVSSLPAKDLSDFSEGYIMSSLYHSDRNGNVSQVTLEWGAKLANIASMDEISDCMLYQSGAY